MSQPVRVKSTLGDDLLFKSMDLTEELGRLFNCELELYSLKQDIELDEVLAQEMTVEIDLPNGKKRFVHGFVSDMALTGQAGDYHTYAVTLRPWLWFLTRSSDCRIFQNKKVPDIILQVFRDAGFTDFKASLTATYRVFEYCVQYKETAFNFISRLMEQEGIYYYFEHVDGKHTLVLADAPSAHSPIEGYESVDYYPPSEGGHVPETVYEWTLSKSVRTGKYRLNAFHFKKPQTSLEATASISYKHPHAQYEYFDYPGEHYEVGEGKRYVEVRMEEQAAQHERVIGRADAMGLCAGGLFELKQYPREDQNREYLLTSVQHSATIGGYQSDGSAIDYEYDCSFEAIPSQVAFRAERITPKPTMAGPQTALVCGSSGEEIDTDEYGRVKVQFRWDSKGKKDQNSSCWVRVAQVWAGSGWGGMAIPRIGQEVIVDFIEGDPDRPIVTGRVYNAENMPPYPLPANKTRSTIMSRSTKGGDAANFNEIRFEDKKGAEEMYIHAEKDQNIVVENNQTIKVGFEVKDKGDRVIAVHHDESIDIGNDRILNVANDKTETIGRDKSITVENSHSESIAKNMTISVSGSLTETVAINYAETVGAAMELTVGGALAISVGASMQQTIGGIKSEKVGAGSSLSIGKDFDQKVGGNKTVRIEKNYEEKIDGQHRQTIAKEFEITAKKIQLVAQDELSIKVGSAQLVLKKSGDITMKGNKLELKGSGDVVIKGSNIKEN